jgi:Leucine-rich repeat (LRR) protein
MGDKIHYKTKARNSEGKIIKVFASGTYESSFTLLNSLKLTEIISIPNHLKVLGCVNNKLTYLPKLPNNLEKLFCTHNNIKQLPNLRELENLTKVSCDIQCFELYMLEMKNTEFNFYC